MNPATVVEVFWWWERDCGREEGEREQEMVYLVRTPLCWVTGGGDQENKTCLFPVTAVNITGVPDGAKYIAG